MRKAATTKTVTRMVSLRQLRWLASARHGAPPPLLLLSFVQKNKATPEFLEVSDGSEVAIAESTAKNRILSLMNQKGANYPHKCLIKPLSAATVRKKKKLTKEIDGCPPSPDARSKRLRRFVHPWYRGSRTSEMHASAVLG